MTLSGQVAVVLGASAAKGTGWAIAEGLAAEGARVVVAARRLEPLQELARRIDGFAIQCDAANPEDIARLAFAAQEHYGKIDIAINSAALPVRGLISELDAADIQRSLDVNFIAQFLFVKHFAAVMTGGGSITLISSAASQQPVANRIAYGCAKAATDALVRHAALEFGPHGIRVNSILPGPIRTDLLQDVLDVPGAEAAFLREIPIGRIATPQEMADIVVWLSKPGSYVTGLNMPVSGGMHLTRPPKAEDIQIPPSN